MIVIAGEITKKSPLAKIIDVRGTPQSVAEWCNAAGVQADAEGRVSLYKRVSVDFLTREGTDQETAWQPSTTVEHHNWKPAESECDGHKFYGCPTPWLADQFRSTEGDRYVEIRVAVADIAVWTADPSFSLKVGFRAGEVLHECDRYGKRIEMEAPA